MKSTEYSDKVLDHFRKPRNVGTLEGDDVVVGRVGNPVCGDLMEFYVKVNEGRIADIKFKTFGCGSAIATASMITELARGKTIDEALKITRQDVANELDGLPPIKMHCSNLAADALKDALKKYTEKQKPTGEKDAVPAEEHEIDGLERFMGRGVQPVTGDLSPLKDKRVIVIGQGDASIAIAQELSKITSRVIFITRRKEIDSRDISQKLTGLGVKVLYESEISAVMGLNTVEKIRVHDLNEGEEYELFVDNVIGPDKGK